MRRGWQQVCDTCTVCAYCTPGLQKGGRWQCNSTLCLMPALIMLLCMMASSTLMTQDWWYSTYPLDSWKKRKRRSRQNDHRFRQEAPRRVKQVRCNTYCHVPTATAVADCLLLYLWVSLRIGGSHTRSGYRSLVSVNNGACQPLCFSLMCYRYRSIHHYAEMVLQRYTNCGACILPIRCLFLPQPFATLLTVSCCLC